MDVSISKDRCVGAGQCVLSAPEVFDQDDEGVVILLSDRPAPRLHGAVREAEDLCPARAIALAAMTESAS